MEIRKIAVYTESHFSEGGQGAEIPVTRVAAAGIIQNPFAGQFVDNLEMLFDFGGRLGEKLMQSALPHLHNEVASYGKAALVGINGDPEHAHAMLHPKLGKAMRDPIGGGAALIPSSAKIAAAGAVLDIPLGHKDDAWSFDHFDAVSICVPDSPRPNEIMMVVALADGGRINPRVGKARVAK